MSRIEYIPKPYQHEIIDFILDTPRCAVFAGMGLGKTSSTLTALSILLAVELGSVLVVAPLRVAASTWPDEIAKWAHLAHLTVSPIVGSSKERVVALAKHVDIYTINYENLPWLVDLCGDTWPFRIVILDESTKVKSFRLRQGGKRAAALASVAHTNIERIVLLTGTPSPNGLIDLWGQLWFVDKGRSLGRSFEAFKNRWFQSIRVGADPFAVRLDPLPYAQEQIQAAIQPICLSLDARDHFDIAEPIVNVIKVRLPAKAMRLYKEMEKEMFIELDNGAAVEAFNAASKTIKCLQLANGAIYTDDTTTRFAEVHDEKLQALESIIEEAAGAPVLVAYHFKSDLRRLQSAFPQGRALDANPGTLKAWNAGRIPILFAHPASAGHGLNLQDGGNIMAFFSHWWNLEEYQQIIERIGPTRQAQAGHDRPVFIHHIVAEGTVDELVMERRESKREVQDILLEALKRRGKE